MELKKINETRKRVFMVIDKTKNKTYKNLSESEAYQIAVELAKKGHEVEVRKEIRTEVNYILE